MEISSINATKFTGNIVKTKKGNEYKSTNTSKYIGSSLGALSGAAYALNVLKNSRRILPKSNFFTIPAFLISILSVFGLGLGTIVDGVINHFKAKKADRTSPEIIENK